mgnify:CR=1 FL=1
MEIEDNQSVHSEESDGSWEQQQIQNLARSLLKERALRAEVIEKEALLLSKRAELKRARSETENRLSELRNESQTADLTEAERWCLESLSSRVRYLTERAEKIQGELKPGYERDNSEQTPALNSEQSYTLGERLNELLFENKTLEKYIRSETFRIWEEKKGSMKFVVALLRQKLAKLASVRESLEASDRANHKLIRKLQRGRDD